MQYRRARYGVILLVMGLIVSGCGGSQAEEPTTTTAEPVAETSTTTTTVPTTTTTIPVTMTIDQAALERAVSVATGFLTARQERNLPDALEYLDESVFMDWGPGTTYETLEAGLAWEDAFGIVLTLEGCAHHPDASEASPLQCELEVQTAVNQANGNEPGQICVDVTLDGNLISHLQLGEPTGTCDFSFWETTFLPFYDWMRQAHPGVIPNDMYDDRISPQGLQLWTQYTNEYLQDHSS